MSKRRAKPQTARRCRRSRRGKSSDATGKFSVRARRATVATSMGTRLHRPGAGGLIHGRQSRRDPAAGAERQLGSSSGGQLSNADGLRKEPILAVEKQGDACVVKLAGELDLYNAPQVRGALTDACADSPNRIVVDLSEVEFIDSTALGVLIEARTQLENRRAFLLAAPGLETKRALEISGLDRHFTVHNSVSEALLAKV